MKGKYVLTLEQMIELSRKVDGDEWDLDTDYAFAEENREKVKFGDQAVNMQFKQYDAFIKNPLDKSQDFYISIYFGQNEDFAIEGIEVTSHGVSLGEYIGSCTKEKGDSNFWLLFNRYKEISEKTDKATEARKPLYKSALKLIVEEQGD